jgi:coiled-coil and C2 domain-containing protein 2A
MLALARWAAHLPFLEDASFRRRRADVWCGSAEALALGGGDHEEHAHLLAGLFLEIGQQVGPLVGERRCRARWAAGAQRGAGAGRDSATTQRSHES